MSADGFWWWTPEEIAEINRVAAQTESNFAKLRAQAFEAVIAAHREIRLESVPNTLTSHRRVDSRSLPSNLRRRPRRADVARNFLTELEDAIRRPGRAGPLSKF